MLIDLHCHSYLSTGCNLDPRAVLERAASHGLDGVAFTETNTQDGCDELFDIGRRSQVKVFVGLELNTDRGQYLCFFPRPEQAPEPVQMWGSNRERPWSAEEVLPKVRQLGAAIIAARPYDRDFAWPAHDFILSQKLLSGVECYNPKVRPSANDLAVEAAEKLKLSCAAGSDARASLDEIGWAATLFKNPIDSQQQLVETLLGGGQFWAVQMGELPRLTRPGEARELEARRGKKRKKRKWGGAGRA
jgi:predicted metal-dependent phosphoesterase TrpH